MSTKAGSAYFWLQNALCLIQSTKSRCGASGGPISFGDLKPAHGEIAVGLSCSRDATIEQAGTSDLSMMFIPRKKKPAFVCSQVTVWLGDWATFEIKPSPSFSAAVAKA